MLVIEVILLYPAAVAIVHMRRLAVNGILRHIDGKLRRQIDDLGDLSRRNQFRLFLPEGLAVQCFTDQFLDVYLHTVQKR